MNVYDFDKTICKDDTETDFFFFEIRRHPQNWFLLPYYINAWHKHKKKKFTHEEYRNRTYLILKFIKDLDKELEIFWKKRKHKILKWYLDKKKDDDVIISATPAFLYKNFFKEMGFKNYIASDFDLINRKCVGLLFYGEEKVRQFKLRYPGTEIDEFYTDSLTDKPLLEIAKKPFLLDKEYNIHPYIKESKNE